MQEFEHEVGFGLTPGENDLMIITSGPHVLANEVRDDLETFPTVMLAPRDALTAPIHVGRIGDRHIWQAEIEQIETTGAYSWTLKRTLLPRLEPALLQAFFCALALASWMLRSRYCGACGTAMEASAKERAQLCPKCGNSSYPNSSPAVIVAVTRDDKLLLARNRQFRSGMHSILAGFVEPGETLEQAVHREVKEEVGITLRDVRYVCSQPWPFPNSLMLGFTAEHADGELAVDGEEIEFADWFGRENLPELPSKGSVARDLIERWIEGAGV